MSRNEFYHALDEYITAHPELDGMELDTINFDGDGWYAIGELNDKSYFFEETENGINMTEMED